MNNMTLLVSAAGFAIFIFSLYGATEFSWASTVPPDLLQKIRGIFFILFGAICVIFHFNTSVGVNLDIRASAIAVSLLFGETGIAILVAFVESLFRFFWEGDGSLVAQARILADLLFCYLAIRYFLAGKPVDTLKIVSMGIIAGAADSLSLLLVSPLSRGLETFSHYGPELFSFNALATLMFGGLLHLQDARLASVEALVEMNRKLQKQFTQSIESLGSAMMHRDPATANHQKRVAEIAVSIAREMKLDGELQECVRIAGLLHDIGQIEIPAEIINRGRSLTPEEFGLVQSHPEAGRNILTGIEFSCDVPEIVYQHHENLDGSGYPRGLHADEILPGAKIIRVADSLEAMLSHRAFRQAHDIEYALEQLEAGSGSKYDPAVVDACKRIIAENRLGCCN